MITIVMSNLWDNGSKPVFSGCAKFNGKYYDMYGTRYKKLPVSKSDCVKLIEDGDRPYNYFKTEQSYEQVKQDSQASNHLFRLNSQPETIPQVDPQAIWTNPIRNKTTPVAYQHIAMRKYDAHVNLLHLLKSNSGLISTFRKPIRWFENFAYLQIIAEGAECLRNWFNESETSSDYKPCMIYNGELEHPEWVRTD